MAVRAIGLMLTGAVGVSALIYGASRYEPTSEMLQSVLGASSDTGQQPSAGGETPDSGASDSQNASAESSGGDDDKKASGKDAKKDYDLPLRPEREIALTTDEGTWLSLDVSPDGQTIIFELLGDIYTMPAAGGAATPLIKDMALNGQPAWSPDGTRIAFISDRKGSENLWIADADGSNMKMLSSGEENEITSPAWSVDGNYVVVSKSAWSLGVYELWMFHKDGGSGVQLTEAMPAPNTPTNQRFNAVGPAPSPDGRYVYYAGKTGGFSYNLTMPQWSIFRRDLDNGTQDVVATAQGSAMRPLISPDGKKLVFATRHDAQTGLRVRDLETGDEDWLIYPVTRDDQESRFTRDLMPAAAFTPDGQSLIMNLDGKIQRVNMNTGAATVIPFTADVSLDVGPDLDLDQKIETGPVKARIAQSPAESPNGRRYAFSALGELYIHEPGSGEPRKIDAAGRSAFQPSWSPDGRSLTYITWEPDGGHIWRINPDRGSAQRVSRVAAYYSNPIFTPDGRQIVALRSSNAAYRDRETDFGAPAGIDLVRMPASGGATTLITHASGLGSPHFADADDRVYVYTGGGLTSMRLDGTDRRTHVQVRGKGFYFSAEPVPADDIIMSPDGDHVLASVQGQLYLTSAPQFDRAGATINVSSPSVPVKRLSDVGADYFGWSADGQAIYWSVGSTIYRQALADISFADDDEKKEEEDTAEAEGNESEGNDADEAAEEEAASDDESDEAGSQEAEESDEIGEDLSEWEPELREADESISVIEINVTVPRDTPSGSILLRGAKVVSMKGDEIIENADLLITGSKIAAVGARGEVNAPADARIIDVAGKTITPGFIDTHAHWFEIRRGVIENDHWGFLANVAYGVTAGLDVQTATNDMFAYQDMIDSGRMIGLRAFSTGPGVFSNNAFKSKDEAYGVLKKYRDHYRTRNIKAYLSGNRKQRHYVMQAAQKLGMLPTTEGALDLKLDLTHAIDGFWGTEHALPITPLYGDVVALMAQSNIAYTPTLLVSYGGPWAENFYYTRENPHEDEKLRRFMPHDVVDNKSLRRSWFLEQEHVFPRLAEDAAKIARAGGRVGVGSHGQLQGLGYHWELWSLASGGMTPMEALHAATLGGADIIGYESEIGSIEPGKYADINIFDADPSEDIRNTASLSMVMQNGRLYNADTLEQVAPNPTPAPNLWFWESDPESRN
jgi:Tol biopolymer transport system component